MGPDIPLNEGIACVIASPNGAEQVINITIELQDRATPRCIVNIDLRAASGGQGLNVAGPKSGLMLLGVVLVNRSRQCGVSGIGFNRHVVEEQAPSRTGHLNVIDQYRPFAIVIDFNPAVGRSIKGTTAF